MSRHKAYGLAIRLGILVVLCASGISSALAAVLPQQDGNQLTLEDLKNAQYYLSDFAAEGFVSLVDGEYRQRYDPDSATELVVSLTDFVAFGDLDGDGVEDAAVVLTTDPGGSGTFYTLAAVVNDGGQATNAANQHLGDRVEIETLSINNGQIQLEMLSHAPDDPACCPSQERNRAYELRGNKLVVIGPLFPHSDGAYFGFVDISGQWAVDPQYDAVASFSEGLAPVFVGGNYGYIDDKGNMVIEPQFAFAGLFSEGLALVDQAGTDANTVDLAYIDRAGNAVIDASRFQAGGDFSEGRSVVLLEQMSSYIDSSGQLVIPPQFDFAQDFSEGLAAVGIGQKFGYIDQQGTMVVEPQFDFASDFSEGLAAVSVEGGMGYIDQTGDFVIEPELLVGFEFSDGLAFADTGERRGYMDQTGKMVVEGGFNFGSPYSEGLAAVEVNGLYGYMDKTGKTVIEPQFTFADTFQDGLAFVTQEGLWGYIDQNGQMLFALAMPEYTGTRPTDVVQYLPPIPANVQTGSCFANSVAVPIASAWRCLVEDQIYDPCLVGDDGETIVCNMNPVTGETGFQISLAEPLPAPTTLPAAEAAGQDLTSQALNNAEYPLEYPTGGAAQMIDGSYTEKFDEESVTQMVITLADSAASGDLDADGTKDAVVVLETQLGGSGMLFEMAAVLNQKGQAVPVDSVVLGDRVIVNDITVSDSGEIIVDMVTHGPNDAMCCPTLEVRVRYQLSDAGLVSSTIPWLIDLADGSTCNVLTEATAAVNDQQVNYACSDQSVVVGGLQVGPVWQAEKVYVDQDSGVAQATQMVNVLTVWEPVDPNQLTQQIGLGLDDVTADWGKLGAAPRGQIRPGSRFDPDVPPYLNGEPPHLRYVFGEGEPPNWAGVSPDLPQLLVYPVEEYREIYKAVEINELDKQLEALEALLANQPPGVEDEIPVLPAVGAVQSIQTQVKYLDFENGSGVRFVTQYAQDVGPIMNRDVFYAFQGLTDDGKYLVAFFYPVATAALPDNYEDTQAAEDYDTFSENFDQYLEQTAQILNELNSSEFIPDLADLDSVLGSLQVGQ